MVNTYSSKVALKMSIIFLSTAVAHPLAAQTSSDRASACASITDSAQRLTCYDNLFAPRKPSVENITSGPQADTLKIKTPPSPATQSKPTPSQSDIEIFGKKEEMAKKTNVINVEITEAYKDLYGKWVFITTTSQVWRQTDIKRGSIPNLPAKAAIKRGAMNGFLLSFEGRNRSFSVKRTE